MGYGSSRQTKELVPSSRITKELGRPKIDWFFSSSVFQFQQNKGGDAIGTSLPTLASRTWGTKSRRQFLVVQLSEKPNPRFFSNSRLFSIVTN